MVLEGSDGNVVVDDWEEAERRARELLESLGTELQWWQTKSGRLRERNAICEDKIGALQEQLQHGHTITKAAAVGSFTAVTNSSKVTQSPSEIPVAGTLASSARVKPLPQKLDPICPSIALEDSAAAIKLSKLERHMRQETPRQSDHSGNLVSFRRFTSQVSFGTRSRQSIASDSDEPPLTWRKVTRPVRRILDSSKFELLIGSLIFMNTMVMAAELQYYGMEAGFQTQFPDYDRPAHEVWPNGEWVFGLIERIFTIIFTVELTLRILVYGRALFLVGLNWIDIFAVVVGLMDWILEGQIGLNPMMARLFRLMKLARGLRLANVSRVMDSLHLLVKCIAASISVLSWSLFLLLLIQCIAGMILSQLVHDIIVDPDVDVEARRRVFSYWGTFSRSQITMFEVNLANFAPACRILLDYCGEWYAAAFLAYRCLAGYAILNVINAVFIQQTIQMAQRDHDVMIRQQEKQAHTLSNELKNVFTCLDTSGDGYLSLEEILAVEEQSELKHWLNALAIDTSDLPGLFQLLDIDGSGVVTFDEFFQGAIRMKGTAKSADILNILRQLRKMNHNMQVVTERQQRIERHIIGSENKPVRIKL